MGVFKRKYFRLFTAVLIPTQFGQLPIFKMYPVYQLLLASPKQTLPKLYYGV